MKSYVLSVIGNAVQDDDRQGNQTQSGKQSQFPFQQIRQIDDKVSRCKFHIVILLHKETHDQTAGDNRSDLSGYIDAHRMHQQEILIVLLQSHLVDDSS